MPDLSPEESARARKSAAIGAAKVIVSALAAAFAYFLMPEALAEGERRMATVFVLALGLWVSEAIPLFATSLVVIAVQAWWIAFPQGIAPNLKFEQVMACLGNPIVFLFLGGFVLARAIQRTGLDTQMAALLLRPFGRRPAFVMAGVMIITAVLSMWMSNTAATAMMIALILPIAHSVPEGDPFRRGVILAVPFAANIGGIGTPIGTPPNAIALSALNRAGLDISFFGWMAMTMPLLIGTLAAMWLLLVTVYRPRSTEVAVEPAARFRLTFRSGAVLLCFGATVLLWLTQPLHGVPNAVIATLPAAFLTITRVIGRADFNSLEWDVLVLIAGGIALGEGIVGTGLDARIVSALPFETLSFPVLVTVCCLVVVGLSTVMSNTVAANIIIPIGVAVVTTTGVPMDMMVLAALIAVACSYAFALPISTPPNAIAYGSGVVSSKDIMLVGIIGSVAATILIIVTGPTVIRFFLGG